MVARFFKMDPAAILKTWNWSQVWTAVAHILDSEEAMEAEREKAEREAKSKAKRRKR